MVRFVALFAGGVEEVVGVVAVFDEENGHVGAGLAEGLHADFGTLVDLLGRHVGEAIEDVDGGIEFGDELGDFGLHFAVAGEAEVDDFAVQLAAEDGHVGHARAGGGDAVGDGCAVEDDGFAAGFAVGAFVDARAFGDADFERERAVAQGEVDHVLAVTGGHAGGEDVGIFGELGGAADAAPAPLAGGGAGVEIEAALADGGHGGTGEGFAAQRPAGVDGGGVGHEADEDAGGVAAEVPDGFADDGFGAGGKAVEGGGEILESEAFDGEFAGVVPVEFHGRGLRGECGGGEEKRPAGDHQTLSLAQSNEMQIVQIFGVKSSSATRAAERFFKERRIPLQVIDLNTKPMAAGEIKRFIEKYTLAGLLDTAGKAYEDAGLKYIRHSDATMLQKIEAEPKLLKLPLVRGANKLAVGADEAGWKEIAAAAAAKR